MTRLGQTARLFARSPAILLGVVLSLTLGVGVSAAVFGYLHSMVVPPLQKEHAEDLMRLVQVPAVQTYAAYRRLADHVRTLDMAVYYRIKAGMGRGPAATPVQLECITHTYFILLGVRPALGRVFEAREDVEGGPPSVVLGYRLWTRRFDADPSIVGTTVELNGRPYTVIGVAPRDFGGVESPGADAWVMLAASPTQCVGVDGWRDAVSVLVVGRIRDPFTLMQASDEISSQRTAGAAMNSGLFRPGSEAPLLPLFGPEGGVLGRRSSELRVVYWIAGGAAAALVLVYANVSALLLLSVLRRRDELDLRCHVGAYRRHVFTQVLSESLLLAALCIPFAVVVGWWTAMVMDALVPVGSVQNFVTLRGLGTVAALVLGGGVVGGVWPALEASGAVGGGKGPHGASALGRRRTLVRDLLVAMQIAVATMLVVAAFLCVRSGAATRRGVGYDLEHVIVASMDVERTGLDAARAQWAFEILRARVLRVPEIEAAALSSHLILGFERSYIPIQVAGSEGGLVVMSADVSSSYFEALGTRIVGGRGFESADGGWAGGEPVVVISEGLARRLWPNGEALGSCVLVGFPNPVCAEIVGISESRRVENFARASDEVFFPLANDATPRALLVRTRMPARAAIGAVTAALRDALPDLPFVEVRHIGDLADSQTRAVRLAARMGGLLGFIAALLAGIGVYATMGESIRQRRRELGVRMALGAGAGDVAWLVIGRGMAILGIGVLLGLAAMGAVVAPAMVALLFGVGPLDALSFFGASGVVGLSGMAGVVGPAVQAVRLDPGLVFQD